MAPSVAKPGSKEGLWSMWMRVPWFVHMHRPQSNRYSQIHSKESILLEGLISFFLVSCGPD